MGVIKDGINFITLLGAFLASYKIWVLFCVGLVIWFIYQGYFNNEVPNSVKWKKAFWISLLIAIVSNIYFWHQTQVELQELQNGNSDSIKLR